MELNELTSSLRDISNMRSASHFKRTICKMAAQRLEAQQTRITQLEAELKEERRWIPVEVRTPDVTFHCETVDEEESLRVYKSIPVLVSCGDKCEMAEYTECLTALGSSGAVDIERCWIIGDCEVCVKYWRPLPEPPEEKG